MFQKRSTALLLLLLLSASGALGSRSASARPDDSTAEAKKALDAYLAEPAQDADKQEALVAALKPLGAEGAELLFARLKPGPAGFMLLMVLKGLNGADLRGGASPFLGAGVSAQKQKMVAQALSFASDGRLEVLPSGQGQLVFREHKPGRARIVLAKHDWTGEHELASYPEETQTLWPGPFARFAPDGRRVAVSLMHPGDGPNKESYSVVVVKTDAPTQLVRITPKEIDHEVGPAWSPDGKWIATLVKKPFSGGFKNHELFLTRPDGSERRRLATKLNVAVMHNGPFLSWSQDGAAVRFKAQETIAEMEGDFPKEVPMEANLSTGEVKPQG